MTSNQRNVQEEDKMRLFREVFVMVCGIIMGFLIGYLIWGLY